MLQWFKNWYKRQNEISQGFLDKAQAKNQQRLDKVRAKADKHIQTMLTASGTKKDIARSCLMQYGLVYPCYNMDYYGGHPSSPNGQENVQVMLIPQGLLIGKNIDLVPIEEIKSVDFKTREQIEKDVTLTRLLAFGMYAFAMKKQKKVITNYLIVKCEKNGVHYALAFAGGGVSNLYTDMFNRLAG